MPFHSRLSRLHSSEAAMPSYSFPYGRCLLVCPISFFLFNRSAFPSSSSPFLCAETLSTRNPNGHIGWNSGKWLSLSFLTCIPIFPDAHLVLQQSPIRAFPTLTLLLRDSFCWCTPWCPPAPSHRFFYPFFPDYLCSVAYPTYSWNHSILVISKPWPFLRIQSGKQQPRLECPPNENTRYLH